jgi:hypothetical protein
MHPASSVAPPRRLKVIVLSPRGRAMPRRTNSVRD